MWCGRHQRAYRNRCVACRAEGELRSALERSQATYKARERALTCEGEGAPRPFKNWPPTHVWQKDLEVGWTCAHCGRTPAQLGWLALGMLTDQGTPAVGELRFKTT